MSQGKLTSCDNKRETGSKMRQLEKDWLTNHDNEWEIGSKSATTREKLAHKKNLKYALRAKKIAAIALRANSTLSPTLLRHVHSIVFRLPLVEPVWLLH